MSEGAEKFSVGTQNQNNTTSDSKHEYDRSLAHPVIRSNLMRSIRRTYCSLCSKPVSDKPDKNASSNLNMKEHDRHLVDIVVELLPNLAHALSKGNDKWIFCPECKRRLVDLQLLASIRNAIGLMYAGVQEELVGEIGNSRTAKRERCLARKSKLMECLEESQETNIIGGLQIDLDNAESAPAPIANVAINTTSSLTITPQGTQQLSPNATTRITDNHKNKRSFRRDNSRKHLQRSTSSTMRINHESQQDYLPEWEERKPIMVFTTPGEENVHENVEYADITLLFEQLQLRKADSKSDLTDKISLASSTSSKSSEDTVTTASSSVFGAMKGQLIEQKRRRPLNDSEVAKFPQLPRGLKMEAVSKQPKFFGL